MGMVLACVEIRAIEQEHNKIVVLPKSQKYVK